VRHVFSGFSVAGLNFLSLPSLGCYVKPSQSYYVSVVAPLVVAGIMLLCAVAARLFDWARVWRGKLGREHVGSRASGRHTLFARSYLSFLLLFYNHLAYECLAAFERVDYRWSEAPLSSWDSGFPLAVITAAVYLLGIPLLLIALVRPRSRNRWVGRLCQCGWMCKTPSMRQSALRPLLRGYRAGAGHLWEPVVGPAWKVLLNAAVVYGAGYRSAQVWCIFGLLVALLAAFTAVRPYAAGIANREQQALLVGSLLVMMGGVMFYQASAESGRGENYPLLVCSYVLVVATLAAMAFIVVAVLVVITRQYYREKAGAKAAVAAGAAGVPVGADAAGAPLGWDGGVMMQAPLAAGPDAIAAVAPAFAADLAVSEYYGTVGAANDEFEAAVEADALDYDVAGVPGDEGEFDEFDDAAREPGAVPLSQRVSLGPLDVQAAQGLRASLLGPGPLPHGDSATL
jgi:hypothetical protein